MFNISEKTVERLRKEYIHEDTRLMISVATIITMLERKELALYSQPQSIVEFVDLGENEKHLSTIKEYSIGFIEKFRRFLNEDVFV